VRPQELKTDFQLVLYLIMNGPGNADSSAFRQALQTGSDVDSIAIDIPLFLDHVSHVDSDPEEHPGRFRKRFVTCRKLVLDIHGTLHGGCYACEFGEKAVAMNRHDAPPEAADEGVHDLEMGLQGRKGPLLVLTHETTVPRGVGAKNSGKLPISLFRGHRDLPGNSAVGDKGESPHRTSPIASGNAIASRENIPKMYDESILST